MLRRCSRLPIQPAADTVCAHPLPSRSCLGEQRVLLVALLASSGQQLLLALAGHKWVAFLGISLGSLGAHLLPCSCAAFARATGIARCAGGMLLRRLLCCW